MTYFGYGERHNVRELLHLLQSEVQKAQFSKVYKWNVNNRYKDIGFNLEVCEVIVVLEAWTRAAFF